MTSTITKNPCSYKQACLNCTMATLKDRPDVCVKLSCPDYEPCETCGKNKILENGICKSCRISVDSFIEVKERDKKKFKVAHAQDIQEHLGEERISAADALARKLTITPPGTPPPELRSDEKEYYKVRWLEYKGYYRNPAANFICHAMILEEIHLSYLNILVVSSRNTQKFEYDRIKQASIDTLQKLQKQLPEREAEELSDDEKSLASIYDSYCKEMSDSRRMGSVHRLLSDEAIALAPNLTFKLDPVELLQRCGYSLVTAEEVAAKYIDVNQIDELKDPDKLLQFFGFKLREKYAMPYDVLESDEEDEGILNIDMVQVIDVD